MKSARALSAEAASAGTAADAPATVIRVGKRLGLRDRTHVRPCRTPLRRGRSGERRDAFSAAGAARVRELLADLAAQVIELRASTSPIACTRSVDLRRVERERALDATPNEFCER